MKTMDWLQYKKFFGLVIAILLSNTAVIAQTTANIDIQWSENMVTLHDQTEVPLFKNWDWSVEGTRQSPFYFGQFDCDTYGEVKIEILDYQTTATNIRPKNIQFSEQPTAYGLIQEDRKKTVGHFWFSPYLISNDGFLQKVTNIQLKFSIIPVNTAVSTLRNDIYESSLMDGTIYKIAVSTENIYKLDYDFLKNTLGIDNLDNIDPKYIQVFGNAGGAVPLANSSARLEDLVENPIFIEGENDGSFDNGDALYFYGKGPSVWKYNTNGSYDKTMNAYDTKNYYFIKIGNSLGQRINTIDDNVDLSSPLSVYDFNIRHENDWYNLIDIHIFNSGSGRNWMGEQFGFTTSHELTDLNISDIASNSPMVVKARTAIQKYSGGSSRMQLNINGQVINGSLTSTVNNAYTERVARYSTLENFNVIPNSTSLNVKAIYNGNGADAWLDYVQINTKKSLRYEGQPLIIKNKNSIANNTISFNILNGKDLSVWNITPLSELNHSGAYPLNSPVTQTNGNDLVFGCPNSASIPMEFIAFDKDADLAAPEAIGIIDNQNLHGITSAELIIVYPADFLEQANRLAEFKSSLGFEVVLVEVGQIFNEFSSGKQDPTAIRDFARMIYNRSDNFKYLLLFGDASFNYRNIQFENDEYTNVNLIPTYQTDESFSPITSYPSDDYFALLSNHEGGNLKGALDIAVGRLSVDNLEEATLMVDKIIAYESSADAHGPWRTKLSFVADNVEATWEKDFLISSNAIADTTLSNRPEMNIQKIFFESYLKSTGAGGTQFLGANQALSEAFFDGRLAINYMGHGGPKQWAHEKVLDELNFPSLNNTNKLPLLITATCSFTNYDNARSKSAGEKIFLLENKGAIALMTTVRAVYQSSNERLTRNTYKHLLTIEDGKPLPIGEILRRGKNESPTDTIQDNARRFTLIGDPSLRLALPQVQVKDIQLMDAQSNAIDTARAMQKVSISGKIHDQNNIFLDGFNGKAYVAVYDKSKSFETLGNNPYSWKTTYNRTGNILFKGIATVNNGQFTITFVVPKDIDYTYGNGKISVYATDGTLDAVGSQTNFVIGGSDPNAANDDLPPVVKVFMNDETFAAGGITNENPVLLANLSDDNGINTTGNSIGHDITAIVDENTQNAYILNDYYESATDDYTKGSLRFPLSSLSSGRHTITVKAWDVANNSGEGRTEFIVADDEVAAIRNVLNYPNPFTTQTEFQFEHNLQGQVADIMVQIYTVSGRLVKTLKASNTSMDTARSTGITWDALDDYGQELAKGVYLYKIQIRAEAIDGSSKNISSEIQKLVLLK